MVLQSLEALYQIRLNYDSSHTFNKFNHRGNTHNTESLKLKLKLLIIQYQVTRPEIIYYK